MAFPETQKLSRDYTSLESRVVKYLTSRAPRQLRMAKAEGGIRLVSFPDPAGSRNDLTEHSTRPDTVPHPIRPRDPETSADRTVYLSSEQFHLCNVSDTDSDINHMTPVLGAHPILEIVPQNPTIEGS